MDYYTENMSDRIPNSESKNGVKKASHRSCVCVCDKNTTRLQISQTLTEPWSCDRWSHVSQSERLISAVGPTFYVCFFYKIIMNAKYFFAFFID